MLLIGFAFLAGAGPAVSPYVLPVLPLVALGGRDRWAPASVGSRDRIGVHTPELPLERDPSNAQAAINQDGLRYPIVQDNNSATWNAYHNQYWPAG